MNTLKLLGIACALPMMASADLPKAADLVEKMGFGMNIGNTMEAPDGPATWGNVYPTEAIIKSMKDAGFTSLRIPCAWVTHADTTTNTINESWMDSVQTVVDLVVNNGMYAILNIHWDSGWLEDRVFDGSGYGKGTDLITNDASVITKRQTDFWRQIGERFKDYDEHLLFASANEPGVNDPWLSSGQYAFDETRMAVLKQYHEAFINTIRSQDGNNPTRTLIVQAPRTDEAYAFSLLAPNMPTDPAGDGYMMAEIHFYPYQWSMMTADEDWGNVFRYWGEGNYSTHDVTHNATYVKSTGATGEQYSGEAYTDSIFKKLGETFTSKGIPVVIGEYAAIKRIDDFSGKAGAEANCDDLKLHLQSRVYWYKKITALSKQYGIVPFHWDVGGEESSSNTIIRRQNGNTGILDYGVLNAMRQSYGLDTLEGDSYSGYLESCADVSNKMIKITYTSAQSDSNETGTMRINVNADWSAYTAISFTANIDVESAGPCTDASKEACSGYAWTSVSFFAMTGSSWSWSDYNLEVKSGTATYTINFSDLDGFDKSLVDAIGLNVYGTQLGGTVSMDNITLIGTDGSQTVYENFDKKLPTLEGIATGELVTSTISSPITAIKGVRVASGKLLVNVQQGLVNASFTAANAGVASAKLLNSLGQEIASQNFMAHTGTNAVQLSTGFRGPAFLVVKSGSQKFMQRIILK